MASLISPVTVVDRDKLSARKPSPFGQANYTPILACQQDITFLESLRDSTKKAGDNNLAFCYFGDKKVPF